MTVPITPKPLLFEGAHVLMLRYGWKKRSIRQTKAGRRDIYYRGTNRKNPNIIINHSTQSWDYQHRKVLGLIAARGFGLHDLEVLLKKLKG